MAGVRRSGHTVAHSQADAMRAALVSGATEEAARALIESLHAASDARTKAFSVTAGWIQALRTLECTAKTVSSRFACVLNSGTVATIADVQAVKMYHFNDSLCQGLNALVKEAEAATRAANTALNDYSTLLLKCLEVRPVPCRCAGRGQACGLTSLFLFAHFNFAPSRSTCEPSAPNALWLNTKRRMFRRGWLAPAAALASQVRSLLWLRVRVSRLGFGTSARKRSQGATAAGCGEPRK